MCVCSCVCVLCVYVCSPVQFSSVYMYVNCVNVEKCMDQFVCINVLYEYTMNPLWLGTHRYSKGVTHK